MKNVLSTLLLMAATATASVGTANATVPASLYSKTFSNEYLVDGNIFGSADKQLDAFTVSGQPFNLTLKFTITNDNFDPLGLSTVEFLTVKSDRLFDFASSFSPYSVDLVGNEYTAIWNGLSAGAYALNIQFAGTGALGTGDARLNGSLTASSVPEAGFLALALAGIAVGLGGKQMRRKAKAV